jgi:hypothetical protein
VAPAAVVVAPAAVVVATVAAVVVPIAAVVVIVTHCPSLFSVPAPHAQGQVLSKDPWPVNSAPAGLFVHTTHEPGEEPPQSFL